MTVTSKDIEAWQGHVGRTETRHDVLAIETLRRFAVAVGADPDVERAPPPLGHWAFFLDVVSADGLDLDGHPRRGGFLPPITLPRRMFAASTLRFRAPLVLGAAAELRMTVANVQYRPGKSGDLVFVEVDRVLVQEGAERVTERQIIVYREASGATAPVQPHGEPDAADEQWTPGPVDLFRFSAVTFNAHRIHYDLSYAQAREGYPGLVVHGPFTAARLCGFASRIHLPGVLRHFSFRAIAPLFAGQPIGLVAGPEPGSFAAKRCDGVTAMTAQAAFC